MKQPIPFNKLSKKEQRKRNAAARGSWGECNPVTRKAQSSKVYNRAKARNWKRDIHASVPGSSFA